MDAAGIDVQVISHTVPATESLQPDQARGLAADANDALAEAIRRHPNRFAGFATLPMSDPPAAAAELDRAVNKLGFTGAMINGHVAGKYLDAQAKESVCIAVSYLFAVRSAQRQPFEEANRFEVVAVRVIHREQDAICADRVKRGGEGRVIEDSASGDVNVV
jgi:predicted TIM-barrel fold metal-dependent hydrolase